MNLAPSELPRETAAFAEPSPRALRPACWVFTLPKEPCAPPASCACCGAPSLREAALAHGVQKLLIGYCEDCAAHVARDATEVLAARLAAAIVGLAACFALPVFLPWASLWLCSGLTLFAAALPFARTLFPARIGAPHTASGRAVWFHSASELACSREAYAREFAGRTGVVVRQHELPRSLPRVEFACILVIACVATPFSHAYQHPSLRILNLGDAPLEFKVDGKPIAHVEPSSGESPFAGVEVKLPAGDRTLQGYDPSGRLLESAALTLSAGEQHLFAAGGADTCFWLETRGYGRTAEKTRYEPLTGSLRFWVIPDDVHGWFLPAPVASQDARVTGGSARVLRQAPCEDAPFSH